MTPAGTHAVHSPSCIEASRGVKCFCDGPGFVEIAPGVHQVREPRDTQAVLVIIEDPDIIGRFWPSVIYRERARCMQVDGTLRDAKRAALAMFDELFYEAHS